MYPYTFLNSPALLKKQVQHCEKNSFDQTAVFDLSMFFENASQVISQDFSPYVQNLNLGDGQTILNTYWNEESELMHREKGWAMRSISKPQFVEICPEEDFERDTIEMAALNVNHIIHQTNERVKRADPAIKLSPVKVNISPLIRTSVLTKVEGKLTVHSTYNTDNAFYNPFDKSIAFLPHSKALKPLLNAYYWEIPMIASHEYGHHVFMSLAPDLFEMAPTGCMGALKLEVETEHKRIVTLSNVNASFNEGVADLVAFYTLNQKETDLRGVRCLALTRDPNSSTMIDGTEKVFSESILDTFFSDTPDYTPSTCEKPNIQDVHTFGAIFAYNADKFLSDFSMNNEQKLKYIMDWARELNVKSKTFNGLSPREYFNEAMKLFFKKGQE